MFSGFLTDQFTRQQPQSRHDVGQCEHTVGSPLQSSTAVCHSDPAATTTATTSAATTTTASPAATTATATTRPDKEYSVADQHQLQQWRPRPPSECQQGRSSGLSRGESDQYSLCKQVKRTDIKRELFPPKSENCDAFQEFPAHFYDIFFRITLTISTKPRPPPREASCPQRARVQCRGKCLKQSGQTNTRPTLVKWLDNIIIFREFLKTLDDQEWQSSLFTLLQNQTFNQVNVKCELV